MPQDWSHYEGFALWLYGTGSGTDLFIDLIENRNPGSTRDDAERWTAGFTDDFTGWKQLRFPFAEPRAGRRSATARPTTAWA